VWRQQDKKDISPSSRAIFPTIQEAIDICDGATPTVTPPNDVVICNGQLREASNDNPSGVFEDGGVTTLAMYPKQPFDFAGRTHSTCRMTRMEIIQHGQNFG
jgi:hypothetical protein